MSKERTGQRHKNKIYFKDQDLDLYLQAFPLNFQTYGGAAAGEAFYAASRVNERDLESWVHEWSALGARVEAEGALAVEDALLRPHYARRRSQEGLFAGPRADLGTRDRHRAEPSLLPARRAAHGRRSEPGHDRRRRAAIAAAGHRCQARGRGRPRPRLPHRSLRCRGLDPVLLVGTEPPASRRRGTARPQAGRPSVAARPRPEPDVSGAPGRAVAGPRCGGSRAAT